MHAPHKRSLATAIDGLHAIWFAFSLLSVTALAAASVAIARVASPLDALGPLAAGAAVVALPGLAALLVTTLLLIAHVSLLIRLPLPLVLRVLWAALLLGGGVPGGALAWWLIGRPALLRSAHPTAGPTHRCPPPRRSADRTEPYGMDFVLAALPADLADDATVLIPGRFQAPDLA